MQIILILVSSPSFLRTLFSFELYSKNEISHQGEKYLDLTKTEINFPLIQPKQRSDLSINIGSNSLFYIFFFLLTVYLKV